MRHNTPHLLLASSLLLSLPLASCGDDGGGGGKGGQQSQQAQEIQFMGDLEAFPDYNYDSGWLPEASPVQVRVLFDAAGSLHAEAGALVGGSQGAPQMSGVGQSGLYELDARLTFQVMVKVDLPGVGYEGPLSDNTDISYEISGDTQFDPFVLDEIASLQANIPETMLVTLPLAGSIPGVEGNVIINIRGVAHSEFSGTCAAVSDSQAQYRANTRTSADIVLLPSLMVEIPFVYNETIDVGEVPVSIPPVELPMDLGSLDVSPGGGDVDGGGSMAKVGSCDDANNGDNNGQNNGANNGANNGQNNGGNNGANNGGNNGANNGQNNVEPECLGDEDCGIDAFCFEGICYEEGGCTSDSDCAFGEQCQVGECVPEDVGECQSDGDCAVGEVCDGGSCVLAPDEGCAQTCNGCCLDGVCMGGNSDDACGVRGARCEVCEGYLTCGEGACGIDPDSRWDIEVVRVDFFNDPNNGEWDTLGGAPDPYVVVGLQYDQDREEYIYEDETRILDDTQVYYWGQVVLEGISANILLNETMGLSLRDSDLVNDETMTSCGTGVSASMLTGQEVSFCETLGSAAFYLKFTPSP